MKPYDGDEYEELIKKKFLETLGKYPKVVRTDEVYFPVSSIMKAFEESMTELLSR
tara:strand:+ start:6448 stop:6612 length:165 start_codon:yes stop_codon:yes gene_type:complete